MHYTGAIFLGFKSTIQSVEKGKKEPSLDTTKAVESAD